MKYIDIHTHSLSQKDVIEICNVDCDIDKNHYYSCGLHPWNIDTKYNVDFLIEIEKNILSKNMVAIGEIGIDRNIDCDIKKQISIFKKQNLIAEKYGLPVIIHSVRAYSDFLEMLSGGINKTPWIFHGYNGNLDIANRLINKNCYLSFGHKLLINSKLQNVLQNIDLDNVFFETDDSSVKIEEVYSKASSLLGIDISLLIEKIYNNFTKIFTQSKSYV
jgi:TatD DNase family protein